MTATKLEIEAHRRTSALRHQLAQDIRRMREDSGLSQTRLAAAAGLTQGYLSRIEEQEVAPTLDAYGRIAAALGADLACRLYPNTGTGLRDRHQAPIEQAILEVLHRRWERRLEVAVRRPARGWVDLVLHDPVERLVIACEIESELRRLEQLLRWTTEKAASLPSSDGWAYPPDAPHVISRLLVVRATRRTREIARNLGGVLEAAFPARPADALAALRGDGAWPGAAILWATPRRVAIGSPPRRLRAADDRQPGLRNRRGDGAQPACARATAASSLGVSSWTMAVIRGPSPRSASVYEAVKS